MVHPATRRAALAAVHALGVGVDVGFVYPPRYDASRGRGVWTGRDLNVQDVSSMLDRAAAANAAGAAVYVRLGPFARIAHPGIVMLDDLTDASLKQLEAAGLQPCLVVETSPRNLQAWVRLVQDESVAYDAVHRILRNLAERFGADPRAVSPVQPGRLPGFTNRKPKHAQPNGQFPFVRLVSSRPGLVAEAGPDLVAAARKAATTQPGAAGRAGPETPRAGGGVVIDLAAFERLDAIRRDEQVRIETECLRRTRPASASSDSEIDFAAAVRAIGDGFDPGVVSGWLSSRRRDKASDYGDRTVRAAARYIEQRVCRPSGVGR